MYSAHKGGESLISLLCTSKMATKKFEVKVDLQIGALRF